MYYIKVPQILYRVFFFQHPKLPPQFEFINVFGNADLETHQCKEIKYLFKDLTGQLTGEFLKSIDLSDGRCRFQSDDKNTVILCYFRNGELQKGPRLHCDLKTKTVIIRSNTDVLEGTKYHTVAEIRVGGPGWTRFFIDDELVKQVDFVDSHSLDWVLP